MRGKADVVQQAVSCIGITPAYAGKRQRDVSTELLQKGSPPPMRGKVALVHADPDAVWITPAYAGKSRRSQKIF